jgi:hypothetical protein
MIIPKMTIYIINAIVSVSLCVSIYLFGFLVGYFMFNHLVKSLLMIIRFEFTFLLILIQSVTTMLGLEKVKSS